VRYQVDLWVHVDPEDKEIVSVHVDDWSLEGPLDVSYWGSRPVPEPVQTMALGLVAEDATWPAWQIGFDRN